MLEPQQFQTQGFIDLRLCRERHNSGIASATAFVPALVNSGLPNDKFVFEGFYLKKRKTNRYLALAEETRTIIYMFLLINY
jgi:16S rRNA (cytidine1402-2'-O)-methyltransferase